MEVFKTKSINSVSFLKRKRRKTTALVIFFVSVALCGNGRSISPVVYLGGNNNLVIFIFLVGLIALAIYLSLLFKQDKGAGVALELSDNLIKVGTEKIKIQDILSLKATIKSKNQYGKRNELTGGENYLHFDTTEGSYNFEFLIENKLHETQIAGLINDLELKIKTLKSTVPNNT